MRSSSALCGPADRPKRYRIGAPPMPHEHGAWVMLYVPMLLGFAVARPTGWAPVLLLLVAVTGAYLARHPADLLLRGKGDASSLVWMSIYGLAALAGGIPLIAEWHANALVFVVGVAGVLFGIHVLMLEWPSKHRLDRSVSGELLAAVGLTLTAPAAVAVARGTLTTDAYVIWAACAAFFGSAVFYVNTLLAGAKLKGAGDAAAKWRVVRASLAYHILLVVAVIVAAPALGGKWWLAFVAYAPVALRALWGAARPARRLPSLKRVGMLETAYAVWFAVAFGAALLSR